MQLDTPCGSFCEQMHGMCARDPRCPDTLCQGNPVRSCSTCKGGPCFSPEACFMPIAEVLPISRRIFSRQRRLLPTTGEAWARLIGAATGLAAAGALAHHFNFF